MIWWLWDAYSPPKVHIFEVDPDSDDLAWLGECGWTAQADNMGLGLITV